MAYTNLGQQLRSNLTSFLPSQQGSRPATDFSSLMATAQQQNNTRQQAQQTALTTQANQAQTAGLSSVAPLQARNQYETQRVAKQQQQAQDWLTGNAPTTPVARNQYEAPRVAKQNAVNAAAPDVFAQWFPGAGLTYNKDATAVKASPNFMTITGEQLAQSPSGYGTIRRAPYAMFDDVFKPQSLDALGQAQMQIPTAMLDYVKDPAEKAALFKELNQYAGGLAQYSNAGRSAYDQFFNDLSGKLQSGIADAGKYTSAWTRGLSLDPSGQRYIKWQGQTPEDTALLTPILSQMLGSGNSIDSSAGGYYLGSTGAAYPSKALNAWVDSTRSKYADLYNKYNQGDAGLQQGALAAAYKAMEAAKPKGQNLGSILSKYISGDEMASYIKSKPTGDYSEGMLTSTGTPLSSIKYILSDGTPTYVEPTRSGHGMFRGSTPSYTKAVMTPEEIAARSAPSVADPYAAETAKWAGNAEDAKLFAKYSPLQILSYGFTPPPGMQAEMEKVLKTPEGMAAARSKAASIAMQESMNPADMGAGGQ